MQVIIQRGAFRVVEDCGYYSVEGHNRYGWTRVSRCVPNIDEIMYEFEKL